MKADRNTLLTALLALGLAQLPAAGAAVAAETAKAASLPALTVKAGEDTRTEGFEGVVEAVRQTAVSAQVPGLVTQLAVKAGDRVAAGQLLVRIDARAAEQNVNAGQAQVSAARANLAMAASELERKRQLFQKNYLSQAALEQAEAAFKAAQAQVNAQAAQVGAAQTQTGFHLVRAPYAGVVSTVSIELGDMAMPGRALVTIYDPSSLRVAAAVPQALAARLAAGANNGAGKVQLELPALQGVAATVTPSRVLVLPSVDPLSLTQTVRADLPAAMAGVVPGMFARLWLPVNDAGQRAGRNIMVPSSAIVRRAELTGLYVLDEQGRPALRQVRLGRVQGDSVEVLSGLDAGERVVTSPTSTSPAR
jgi:membrane fusion protein, multidrug efflux system